ncbi:L,D-transpeptidase [Fulvimarina sp. 2208YS6-2-32]|uniref:L,D-transpeptidase n=1 Tax=Fulvimarina uroteuthidis TaxID=3098149 RepID=A0ABU5HYR9_9HYPH|nr:L,D-transpeptidase [Fulvimarina sp. 2208YS6-2-32]MDY8107739.1 L,D-transpeptidase [Fulvimarina sp. 2208YS6-2-32]
MQSSTPRLSATFAALVLVATSFGGGALPAKADQRYSPRPPVEAPQEVRDAWLFQLKRERGVNAAGVVFGGPLPQATRTAGRSIFSPHPFAPERPVAVRGYQPRQAVRPGLTRHARPYPAATRQVAPQRMVDPAFLPQRVPYGTRQKPGTIVIDTKARFLYHVGSDGTAMRYGVGVGKPGFSWRGTHKVTQKKKWPGWTPPREMIAREKKKGRILPAYMPGGQENPLGARALYLGSTLYRIHGTNQPWTIGQAVSSGCIRMRNQDVEALYEQVGVGTKVVVL